MGILSDLRFQADAALLLLCVMLLLNAAAAVFLVPAWIRVFKPKFIMDAHYDQDGILVNDAQGMWRRQKWEVLANVPDRLPRVGCPSGSIIRKDVIGESSREVRKERCW